VTVLIGVQAARQGWLRATADERVSTIDQERRRAVHPKPSGVILAHHDLPRHPRVGPAPEQRGEPAAQDLRTRAIRHVQDLKSHRIF
jgi:hypothetical protein